MPSVFGPLLELIHGDAYHPHPSDASLSLGRRFAGKTVVVIGGGGTGNGWTQRVGFDRQGAPSFRGRRTGALKRGTPEWGQHLLEEARASSGWAVLLVEQQWQAAIASSSGSSVGASGVEQMLRVRDAVGDFGDERIAEDAVRAAIDHPTMEGAVVVGVRGIILDPLEKEARAHGFEVAAIRIGVAALLERHLGRLQIARETPTRSLVAYDGQSALLVGIRDGAFDGTEGGISYLVNRSPADVRAQVAKRICSPTSLREWNGRVEIIGSSFSFDGGSLAESVDLHHEADDVVSAAMDERVRHDLRPDLQEMRPALPSSARAVFLSALVLIFGSILAMSVQASEAVRLKERTQAAHANLAEDAAAEAQARAQTEGFQREAERARAIAEWVDRNYHAQALVHGFLAALPVEVSLDAVSVQASEGLPQAKLRFTLLGSEEAQRAALRAVESRLYQLGYEVGRREDPVSSTTRRGGVVYAWDLILPSFGS